MSSSHSSDKQSRWHISKELGIELVVELVAGGILGKLLIDWACQGERAQILGIAIGAVAVVIYHLILKTWHLAVLYDLANRPSLRILWRGRKPAFRVQISLRRFYDAIEQRLLEVVSAGRSENCSYRDQMDLAFLFYGIHTKKFWATSFDTWSTFLLRNELYLRQMTACTHQQTQAANPIDGPGSHARIFILPLKTFLDDVLREPAAARILVKHHLEAWQSPIRLLLHDEHSYLDRIKEDFRAPSATSPPVIPDFMIVDDLFVYGRMAPERVEAELMKLHKLEPPRLVLGYSADPIVVKGYDELFGTLWADGVDVHTYCISLRERSTAAQGLHPAANSRGGAAAYSTLRAMTDYAETEKKQLFAIIRNIEDDLDDFLNKKERGERYSGIDPELKGDALADKVLSYVKNATGEIWAIDQADVKREDRFWVTWQQAPDYKRFNVATVESRAPWKERIFVIKTWDHLADHQAMKFFEEQLRSNIGLGFISQEDVNRLASRTVPQSDENGSNDPSRSSIDSDFILIDLDHTQKNGREAGKRTRGFETTYKQYDQGEISYQTSLPCKGRIDRLFKWYREVRDSDYALLASSDFRDMDALKERFLSKAAASKAAASKGALT